VNLEPDETDLLGTWVDSKVRVTADAVTDRIEFLVSHCLEEIAVDTTGWETLYRDPQDGRYWELTYPQGEIHGGGPPRLRHLPAEEAKGKYKV
jgi:hypothetical protein